MAKVTSKLEQLTLPDPAGRVPDPWADFREIEIIELLWTQQYRHTLGKNSRFFLALEEGRFLATRCPECDKVYAPPRPLCPDDLTITEWTELSGRGRLVSWSVLHHAPATVPGLATPYVLAYVRLHGADTLFAHLLRFEGDVADIRHGLPVRVIYDDGPVAHPLQLMAFAPEER